MNLYQQLTEPHRAQLQEEAEKYPTTGKLLKYALEHNSSVMGLTIKEAMDLHTIFFPFEPFSLSNLFSLL
jgi:hypothetical protein